VTYTPVDAGADTGCLTVASDDPATPSATLQLTGTGSQVTVAGDVDIERLSVPEEISSYRDRQVVPRARLVDRSSTDATATARLTATLNGAPAYDQTMTVTVPAGVEQTVTFPPLLVDQGTRGTIAWKLHVEDQDPDDDTATARTRVEAPEREGEDDRASGASPTGAGSIAVQAKASPPMAATGGCSSGGPSASLGLLVALGALLLAPRRRRP
jgi:uncharacterized protein (TIGR03382 family)